MTPSLLLEWISDPKLLDRESLAQLRSIISEYPCFTPARVLYLKNLNLQNDLRFSSELNRTAISVPDRKRLYYFMEDRLQRNEGVDLNGKKLSESGFSIIDHFLHNSNKSQNTEKTKTGKNPEVHIEKDSGLSKPSLKAENVVSNNTYPLKEGDGFTLDYLSYLSIYQKTEISATASLSPSNKETALKSEPMKGQELIDAFLLNPDVESGLAVIRDKEGSNSDGIEHYEPVNKFEATSDAHIRDIPEASFTETLARIYLKQKRYDRALEIIKSLSLKYPEKNVYFADQIRFLEKLIINTKKQ